MSKKTKIEIKIKMKSQKLSTRFFQEPSKLAKLKILIGNSKKSSGMTNWEDSRWKK
jgi:hypothetical protein